MADTDERNTRESPPEGTPGADRQSESAESEEMEQARASGAQPSEEQELSQAVEASKRPESEDAPDKREDRSTEAGKDEETEQEQERSDYGELTVVAMGASAGGLQAFEEFFTNMPSDSGMAFAIVQHMDPSRKSMLPELIQRYTEMKVHQVEDGMELRANHVFIIPPNRVMTIMNGRLFLSQEPGRHPQAPIDAFFRSLADDRKDKAIGIVLSGTGSEGSVGLREIKGKGGMVMIQDPESATHAGMPQNALRTGLQDYVLRPEEMPSALVNYVRHQFHDKPRPTEGADSAEKLLGKLFMLLRSRTGHDFSSYKRSVIYRRIERRMAVNHIENLGEYIEFARRHRGETGRLFKDLLILVSGFFRDREAWETLQEKVLPDILKDRDADSSVRVWVVGCATGEEAYTAAILLSETMKRMDGRPHVQIFGTDLSAGAVETARKGRYPKSIGDDIPQDLLKTYFSPEDDEYVVRQEIRDMLVFAEQNLVEDPPFSKMDLICCRNLLIYFSEQLQRRVIPKLHYALKPGGYLFLGNSETVGQYTDLFKTVDRQAKIYRRIEGKRPLDIEFPAPKHPRREPSGARPRKAPSAEEKEQPEETYAWTMQRMLLNDFAPTAVLIDQNNNIVHVIGRTGKFLELQEGDFSGDIVNMARSGLKADLSTTIRRAFRKGAKVSKENVVVDTNGGRQRITLTVKPITEPPSMEGLFAVYFEEMEEADGEEAPGAREETDREDNDVRVGELERELADTKENLQTTIEELETSNEELKSSNEELHSSNEELQSTNEELETSKEELQSVNEELRTVNAELQDKNEDLIRAQDDMANLLASTGIGTLFLDSDLKIQQYTPETQKLLNVIESDIGRPVNHITTRMDYDGLVDDADEALRTLESKETEVQGPEGTWYMMRIRPYKTRERQFQGVVVTFSEITKLKNALEKLEESQAEERTREEQKMRWQAVFNTVRLPLLLLNEDLSVEQANKAFYEQFRVQEGDTVGNYVYDLGNRQWDIPHLRELLEKILPEESTAEDFKVEHEFDTIGRRVMLVNARRLDTEVGPDSKIFVSFQDVTEEDEGSNR